MKLLTQDELNYKLMLDFLAYLKRNHIDLIAPTIDGEGGYIKLFNGVERVKTIQTFLKNKQKKTYANKNTR